MIRTEDVYRIGRIGKPHGVKGEVQMQFDDDAFDREEAEYVVLEVDGIMVPFFIEEYRFRSDTVVLMKFLDIDTQEQARGLTGCEVFFPRSLTGQSQPGEWTWSQIVGYHIFDQNSQRAIGTITAVDTSTVNILFEVRTDDGRELLIPASVELIASVDDSAQEVAMRLPEGLLDLD